MALRGAYGVLREDVVEDDSGAASPEALAPPSVAVVSSRMLGKHVGQVLNYLALLAWNRCVMRLVGGPTRTTIDVLMTRQFHGIALVWTWAYALGVSSACVAVVRWSAEKRASLEEEETAERTRDGEDVRLDAGRRLAALRALRRSPIGSPFRFTRRFRAFAHARLQGACTYVAMWALAVASLGTLPARTVGQDRFPRGGAPLRGVRRRRRARRERPRPTRRRLRRDHRAGRTRTRRRHRRGGRRASGARERNVARHAFVRARDVRVDRRGRVGRRGEAPRLRRFRTRRRTRHGATPRPSVRRECPDATRGLARRAPRGGRARARSSRRAARRRARRAVGEGGVPLARRPRMTRRRPRTCSRTKRLCSFTPCPSLCPKTRWKTRAKARRRLRRSARRSSTPRRWLGTLRACSPARSRSPRASR